MIVSLLVPTSVFILQHFIVCLIYLTSRNFDTNVLNYILHNHFCGHVYGISTSVLDYKVFKGVTIFGCSVLPVWSIPILFSTMLFVDTSTCIVYVPVLSSINYSGVKNPPCFGCTAHSSRNIDSHHLTSCTRECLGVWMTACEYMLTFCFIIHPEVPNLDLFLEDDSEDLTTLELSWPVHFSL